LKTYRPIARLRVQGEVNEVRTAHLRFTKKEVATYLNERMGLDLSSAGIATLAARTEGRNGAVSIERPGGCGSPDPA
jgi:LuxR family maltose regulon positive regulatory protein